MAKAPSTETQLRTARADIRRLTVEVARANQQAAAYRTRATQAEREVGQWKQRFDILLRRDGVKTSGDPQRACKEGVACIRSVTTQCTYPNCSCASSVAGTFNDQPKET